MRPDQQSFVGFGAPYYQRQSYTGGRGGFEEAGAVPTGGSINFSGGSGASPPSQPIPSYDESFFASQGQPARHAISPQHYQQYPQFQYAQYASYPQQYTYQPPYPVYPRNYEPQQWDGVPEFPGEPSAIPFDNYRDSYGNDLDKEEDGEEEEEEFLDDEAAKAYDQFLNNIEKKSGDQQKPADGNDFDDEFYNDFDRFHVGVDVYYPPQPSDANKTIAHPTTGTTESPKDDAIEPEKQI